jgi:hypothetical protein
MQMIVDAYKGGELPKEIFEKAFEEICLAKIAQLASKDHSIAKLDELTKPFTDEAFKDGQSWGEFANKQAFLERLAQNYTQLHDMFSAYFTQIKAERAEYERLGGLGYAFKHPRQMIARLSFAEGKVFQNKIRDPRNQRTQEEKVKEYNVDNQVSLRPQGAQDRF